MKKYNAAVYLLSGRVNLLEKCLSSFFKNWNNKYKYPVFVHYFGNIYSKNFIKKIRKNVSPLIEFRKVKTKLPKNLKEKDLFYNKKHLRYVRETFSKKRLGYLHGQRFWVNLTSYGKVGCLCKDLKKYDYLMRIDDDSGFLKKINYDLFDKLKKYPFATGYTWNNYNYTHKDTRVELWNFYKNYLKKFKYTPKNKILKKAVKENDEYKMHKLAWSAGNINFYNIKLFLKHPWKEYLKHLNQVSGDYKYRWGDIETIGLFAYTHFSKPIYDHNLKEKRLYTNKIDSHYSTMVPSTYSKFNLHNSKVLSFYHWIKYILRRMKLIR